MTTLNVFFLLIIINISFFFVNLPLIIYSLKETKDYDDKENHWIEFVDMITDFFENHLKHSKLCLILVHIIFVLYFVFHPELGIGVGNAVGNGTRVD